MLPPPRQKQTAPKYRITPSSIAHDMAATEGLRQRRKLNHAQKHDFVSSSALEQDEDDAMIKYDNPSQGQVSGSSHMHRSASMSNLTSGEVSALYRFVNHFVLRYCLRIRDALRSMIGGGRSSGGGASSLAFVPPSPQTSAALEVLDTVQKTPFNFDVEDHEQGLQELWALLGSECAYARIGTHWGRVGFQGKDPSTDFRGQGALGLRNMVYFAKMHTEFARSMIATHESTLPYAISVINISAHLLSLVSANAGRLGNALFEFVQTSSEALALFDSLFCLVFQEFVSFHREAISAFIAAGGNPALAVMQFNPIRAKVANDCTFFLPLDSGVNWDFTL